MTLSKMWLVVSDGHNHQEFVDEVPLDGRDPHEVREEMRLRYPIHRYGLEVIHLSEPGLTAIPMAKSWAASDYFSEQVEARREEREKQGGQ